MRKFFCLIVCFILMFALTGCGSENESQTISPNNLGITAEEFMTAYNKEMEKENISRGNDSKHLTITNIDSENKKFVLYDGEKYFSIEYDESEGKLSYIMLQKAYVEYDDNAQEILGEDNELINSAVIIAASLKSENPEELIGQISEKSKSSPHIFFENGNIDVAVMRYRRGYRYFIAAKNFAKNIPEFAEANEKMNEYISETASLDEANKQRQEDELAVIRVIGESNEEKFKGIVAAQRVENLNVFEKKAEITGIVTYDLPNGLKRIITTNYNLEKGITGAWKIISENERVEDINEQALQEQNNQSVQNNSSQSATQYQVIAVSGCVIVNQDGHLMTYKKKCEACGYLLPGSTTSGITKGSGTESQINFICPKCKSHQTAIIRGV